MNAQIADIFPAYIRDCTYGLNGLVGIDKQCTFTFQNFLQNFRKWQILDGSEHFGRFGASVASVGDLDLDGYDELCVGEPYADEGRGRVVLFRGSSSGVIETPSQILRGVTYGAATAAFGFSIRSGDKDLDGNGYPDLLIGSPDSNSVIVIK